MLWQQQLRCVVVVVVGGNIKSKLAVVVVVVLVLVLDSNRFLGLGDACSSSSNIAMVLG